LAFDGRGHHLERGYWIKFEIRRVEPSPTRPHGLNYSFTLHGPDGARLVGFDNAHPVPSLGSTAKRRHVESDHWPARKRIQGDRINSGMPKRCLTTSLMKSSGFCSNVGSKRR
jgi:hypothetical protein